MQVPNHTQVPNEFIEARMSSLGGAAVKVFLAICRKTIGWHKQTDCISYTQLKAMTGLQNAAVTSAVKELLQAQLVVAYCRPGRATKFDMGYTELSTTSPESGAHLTEKRCGTSPESGDTKEKKETTQKKGASLDPVFEEIWASYPRKVNKAGCRRAFEARRKEGESVALMAACAQEYGRVKKGEDEKYVLHGSTFFGPDKRYLDYKPKPAKPAAPYTPAAAPAPLTDSERAEGLEALRGLGRRLRKEKLQEVMR